MMHGQRNTKICNWVSPGGRVNYHITKRLVLHNIGIVANLSDCKVS
jgi:hypothetical protein